MRALYRMLERAGLQMGVYHEGWSWAEAVEPAPDGSQNTCRLFDYAAIVTSSAMLTADTCTWIAGPLGELHRRAAAAKSPDDLVSWLRRKRSTLGVHLANIQEFQGAGFAFGVVSRTALAAQASAAITALVAGGSEEDLAKLKKALGTLAPRPVIAGLYRPGAAGPVGQFALHLREWGLPYEEIVAILDDLKAPDTYPSVDAYKRRRTARVDAIKHRINGEKAKLRRMFGDDRVLETSAQNLPRQGRPYVVLFSIRVEKHSTATIHL
jgi:hypothetical protein